MFKETFFVCFFPLHPFRQKREKKKKAKKTKKNNKKLPIIFIALVTVGENKFSGYYPAFGQNVVLSYRRWASSMLTLLRVGVISLEALLEMPHWHTDSVRI